MIWLSWRQQRTETAFAVAGLAVLGAYVVWAGLRIASAYTHYRVAACHHLSTNACFDATHAFTTSSRLLGSGKGFSMSALLGMIGIGLAAPVVSELVSGTATFSWTQGVTRARWLRPKLALAVLTAVVVGTTVTLLVSWARGTLNTELGPYSHDAFDLQGVVPIAYCVFALGLGLFFGVLLRRTVPAAIVALVAWGATRIFVDTWLRQRLWPPVTAIWPPTQNSPIHLQDWVVAGGYSNRAGLVSHATQRQLDHCYQLFDPTANEIHISRCFAKLGATYNHQLYFPATRFWDYQAIEASMYVAAALVLMAFAAWRVLRTD